MTARPRKGPRLLREAHPEHHCRICEATLKVYERPERICDGCLRAHQTMPWNGYAHQTVPWHVLLAA